VRSLLDDGDLDLRNNLGPSGARLQGSAAMGRNGEWYPKHPILLPLLSLPFAALAGDLGLLAFNVVQVSALVLLLWCAVRRHTPTTATWIVTLWFAFGTLLRPFTYNYSPDVLSTLLVVSAYLAVAGRRPMAMGFLAGLAICAKLPNAIVVAPLFAWAAVTFPRYDILRAALTFTIPLLALGWLHASWFGSPLVTPYDRVIEDPRVSLTAIEASHRTFFDVPFWRGLWTQLTHRQLGLLVSAPAVVLALPGLVLLWRRTRIETLVLTAVIIAQITFYARYRLWDQTTHGHRFLLTAIVLAAVPAGAALARLLGERSDHEDA
jgi:hypothetical protein